LRSLRIAAATSKLKPAIFGPLRTPKVVAVSSRALGGPLKLGVVVGSSGVVVGGVASWNLGGGGALILIGVEALLSGSFGRVMSCGAGAPSRAPLFFGLAPPTIGGGSLGGGGTCKGGA